MTVTELRAEVKNFMDAICVDFPCFQYAPGASLDEHEESPSFEGSIVLVKDDDPCCEYIFQFGWDNEPGFYVGDNGDFCPLTEAGVFKYLYLWHAFPEDDYPATPTKGV